GNRGDFRQTQPCLYRHQDEGMVTSSKPGVPVWRGKQRIDLRMRQETNQSPSKAFAGNGEHALDLRRVSRKFERDVAEERVNRGEAQVAATYTQPALLLQVVEERDDQRRMDLFEGQLGWRRMQPLLCELQ